MNYSGLITLNRFWKITYFDLTNNEQTGQQDTGDNDADN